MNTNITKAIIAVMQEVKGVEKNMQVGFGNNSYKGVSDKDVKETIGRAMAKHGLAMVPTSTDAKSTVSRWEEGGKSKQSILTEVHTKYLLIHESGESIEVSGYGQGIDTQDKGAGKATTYALKYALLYTFLVPTGQIDDADNTHSDAYQVPSLSPEWSDAIDNCNSLTELTSFYKGNKEVIEANHLIKNYITKRKEALLG